MFDSHYEHSNYDDNDRDVYEQREIQKNTPTK